MKKEVRKYVALGVCFLVAFGLWTLAVLTVDVQAIGPGGSSVGLATINRFVHDLTGVHMDLYVITDWLGLVPFFFVLGFGILGLVQWIGRKRLKRVDYSILVLGGFDLAVMGAYVLFEILAVNYRPVLIEGVLEASYPSSTTMLVMCVMPTAMMELHSRMTNTKIRRWAVAAMAAFTAFMVIARFLSGVHWVTDIVGGGLLSAGFVLVYYATIRLQNR